MPQRMYRQANWAVAQTWPTMRPFGPPLGDQSALM